MDRNQFLHWLEQIYSTRDEETDCENFREVLPAYVDFEVTNSGQTPTGDRLELVTGHLTHCPDCAEEHAALFTVARMLADGNLLHAEKSLALFEKEPALEGEIA